MIFEKLSNFQRPCHSRLVIRPSAWYKWSEVMTNAESSHSWGFEPLDTKEACVILLPSRESHIPLYADLLNKKISQAPTARACSGLRGCPHVAHLIPFRQISSLQAVNP